ncbi:MAG TPA: 3-isopropylmalate dehydratase small subunit [bacterium]|nr:3-isopropylmalate dehydratase small subunit [bacterium]
MEPFKILISPYVALPMPDIDTDQIIPARFLKITDKVGLGKNLFHDWRYQSDGSENPDFILNQQLARQSRILVAGDNFGCGSSREHAPWALLAFGFHAVISTRFADIFCSNSYKNGLLPVPVASPVMQKLIRHFNEHPGVTVAIDLAEQTLTLPAGEVVTFPIDSFNKACLLEGIDQLGYILRHENQIAEYEKRHPARFSAYV